MYQDTAWNSGCENLPDENSPGTFVHHTPGEQNVYLSCIKNKKKEQTSTEACTKFNMLRVHQDLSSTDPSLQGRTGGLDIYLVPAPQSGSFVQYHSVLHSYHRRMTLYIPRERSYFYCCTTAVRVRSTCTSCLLVRVRNKAMDICCQNSRSSMT